MTYKDISSIATRASRSLGRAKEDYEDCTDCSDLPEVFHKVAEVLPVAQKYLKAVHQYCTQKDSYDGEENSDDGHEDSEEEQECYDEMKDGVNKVQECANDLGYVFQKVINTTLGDRAAAYQKQIGEDREVDVMMKDILEAILDIAAVTDEELDELRDALSAISQLQAAPKAKTGASINNYGSGPQSIHQGNGPQNINAGSGHQFNGSVGSLSYKT